MVESAVSWVVEAWPYALGWLAFLGALIIAIKNTYSAERDRQALKSSELEREKLSLEVQRLKNDPEIVADRRSIYESLRGLLGEVFREAATTRGHISKLHHIRHDAVFRFPDEIVTALDGLISDLVDLHISGEKMRAYHDGHKTEAEYHQASDENNQALRRVIAFNEGLVDMFKPHLSL